MSCSTSSSSPPPPPPATVMKPFNLPAPPPTQSTCSILPRVTPERHSESRRGDEDAAAAADTNKKTNHSSLSASAPDQKLACSSTRPSSSVSSPSSSSSSSLLAVGSSFSKWGMDSQPLPTDFTPGPWDVICAKGKTALDHVGNRRLKVLVHMKLKSYAAASTKLAKGLLVTAVVQSVQQGSRRGGFVRPVAPGGPFVRVGDSWAREKVGQMFRDALYTSYKSSTRAKKERARRRRQKVPKEEDSGLLIREAAEEEEAEAEASAPIGPNPDHEEHDNDHHDEDDPSQGVPEGGEMESSVDLSWVAERKAKRSKTPPPDTGKEEPPLEPQTEDIPTNGDDDDSQGACRDAGRDETAPDDYFQKNKEPAQVVDLPAGAATQEEEIVQGESAKAVRKRRRPDDCVAHHDETGVARRETVTASTTTTTTTTTTSSSSSSASRMARDQQPSMIMEQHDDERETGDGSQGEVRWKHDRTKQNQHGIHHGEWQGGHVPGRSSIDRKGPGRETSRYDRGGRSSSSSLFVVHEGENFSDAINYEAPASRQVPDPKATVQLPQEGVVPITTRSSSHEPERHEYDAHGNDDLSREDFPFFSPFERPAPLFYRHSSLDNPRLVMLPAGQLVMLPSLLGGGGGATPMAPLFTLLPAGLVDLRSHLVAAPVYAPVGWAAPPSSVPLHDAACALLDLASPQRVQAARAAGLPSRSAISVPDPDGVLGAPGEET